MLLRASPGVSKEMRILDGDGHFVNEGKMMLRRLEGRESLPKVRNARALHDECQLCAACACTLDEGSDKDLQLFSKAVLHTASGQRKS